MTTANTLLDTTYLDTAAVLKQVAGEEAYRAWGYDSLDEALAALYDQGILSFTPDQAHTLMQVADLVGALGPSAKGIPFAVLVSVSSLPVEQQVGFLTTVTGQPVSAVGQAVRDALQLAPWTFGFTPDRHEAVRLAIAFYRTAMQVDASASDAAVLALMVAGVPVK